MKVLMTADAVGGVWTYALELCRALSEQRVSVVLATMGPLPSDEQRVRASSRANVQLRTSSYRLEWMNDPWIDVVRAGEWLLELAAQERVDLVHSNGFTHAALPWGKPVVVVAHSCVYSWWYAVHGESPPPSWERYRRMVETGLENASVVVAPTHAFMRQLRQSYTFSSPVRVISNTRIALSRGDSAEPELKEPLIFASGRLWDEAKNMRTLDRAARELKWPVVVAGDTRSPDGKVIRADALQCIGQLDERHLASWLARASIFVHPALYEPFGLAVLEAAHAGCALVLSDVESLRELWADAALFVNARDPMALERSLSDLIEHAEVRASLARRARARAELLSSTPMGEQYFALYRDLLHNPARERSVA